MLFISYIDGTTEDIPTALEPVVAFANFAGNPAYFVHDIDGEVLRAIPEKLVTKRVYTEGDYDLPSPEVYLQEHESEIQDVDMSLLESTLVTNLN
jgi:hypothetical protein